MLWLLIMTSWHILDWRSWKKYHCTTPWVRISHHYTKQYAWIHRRFFSSTHHFIQKKSLIKWWKNQIFKEWLLSNMLNRIKTQRQKILLKILFEVNNKLWWWIIMKVCRVLYKMIFKTNFLLQTWIKINCYKL